MRREYTIGQLARAAGILPSTVRYYERVGLLSPEDRSAGNYRLYGEESLRRLKFIRAAQAIGFRLDDVKELLATPDASAASCRQVQSLIEQRLAEVAQRLKELRHVQQVLKATLDRCHQRERSGVCHVLKTLRD